MTEYYKYHHWNIVFNRRKENNFNNDHCNTSSASSRLMKYSQNQFEKTLRVEHERLLGEYHDDIVKNQIPQSSPRNRSAKLDQNILKSSDEISLPAVGRDEVIGSHFIPGLQHAPGISSSHLDSVPNARHVHMTDPSSAFEKNLSLFALIEQNALTQQDFHRKVQNANKYEPPDLHKLLTPKFTAFETFSDRNKSESFIYLSPAQLSLKYYLKQCRPQSAPGSAEERVKTGLLRPRSKSAKLRSKTATTTVTEKPTAPSSPRHSSVLYTRSKKVLSTTIPSKLPSQEIQATKGPGADNIDQPSNIKIVVDDFGPSSANHALGLHSNELEEELSGLSKKVDFGPEVKPGAAIQSTSMKEKPDTAADNVVLAPRGILHHLNLEKSQKSLDSFEEKNQRSTLSSNISKTIGFSKVKYEDGSTAVFSEKGELTMENQAVVADGDADAASKGKKGKGKKADKTSAGKGKKGKGKSKKGETSDSEVEEPVRRRKKDMKFCSKLLYSIAAISEVKTTTISTELETEPEKEHGKFCHVAWDSDSKEISSDKKVDIKNKVISATDKAFKSDSNIAKTSHVTFSFNNKQSNVPASRKQSAGILKK